MASSKSYELINNHCTCHQDIYKLNPYDQIHYVLTNITCTWFDWRLNPAALLYLDLNCNETNSMRGHIHQICRMTQPLTQHPPTHTHTHTQMVLKKAGSRTGQWWVQPCLHWEKQRLQRTELISDAPNSNLFMWCLAPSNFKKKKLQWSASEATPSGSRRSHSKAVQSFPSRNHAGAEGWIATWQISGRSSWQIEVGIHPMFCSLKCWT